jgi:hypothetical protein
MRNELPVAYFINEVLSVELLWQIESLIDDKHAVIVHGVIRLYVDGESI